MDNSEPDRSFRSKAPDLLRDLAAHVVHVLVEYTEMDQTKAEYVGAEVAERMAKTWGGQNVYFPMAAALQSHRLALQVWEAFDGRNLSDVARRFGISLPWAYKIIKAMRTDEMARRQAQLFEQNEQAPE